MKTKAVPTRPLRAFLLLPLVALTCVSASGQQTVTLQPSVPKIVAGANFTSPNTYVVPVIVTFAGGNDPVNLGVSGAPAGATAIINPNTLTNSALVDLIVSIAGVAKGGYPLTISASGAASATANVDLIAGQLWTATSLANATWSVATNWSTGIAAGAGDHVKIEDAGVISNIVSASTTIDSLTYARFTTGATNNTVIAPGATLSVVGTGGFSANVESTNGLNKVTTVNISGVGGTLVVSNDNANFSVNALNAGGDGTRFNLQGLDNFTAAVNRFGLGDVTLAQQGGWGQQLIRVTLARTNLIRAGFVGAYNELENTNSITFFNNSDRFNNGSANNVDLGIVNIFEADSFNIAKVAAGSGNNILRFNATFLTGSPRPSASFRGVGGGRMALFAVGLPSGTQNVAANSQGTADFRGGTLDLLVDTIILGANRSRYTNTAGNTFGRGTLAFNAGTVDVNVARLGFQRYTNDAYGRGTIAVGGSGVLVVNDYVELGYTTGGDPISGDVFIAQTFGQLIATNGGTVRANRITVGAASTNNNIMMSGGNVVVSNTIASAERPLNVLDMANSALTLHLDGLNTNVHVVSLVSGGLQNLINIAAVANLGSYPVQVPLIAYQSTPSAPNFSMGTLPPGLYGALINNPTTKTIDAIISTNPPNSLVWRGDKSDNWDHSTLNWVLAGTAIETNFADGDFVLFDNTLTGSGNVSLAEIIVPGQSPTSPGITVSNGNYAFSGSGAILGTARTLKAGTGTLTFNGSSETSMQVSQGALTGSGTVGAVSVSSGAALSFSGNINGGLTCAGFATNGGTITGPLTLQTGGVFENNGNTLGTLTLQSGTLLTNSATMNAVGSPVVPTNCTVINAGTIGGVRVDVNAGGTLKGTGIFEMSNRVQVNAGGTLIPGSSIGIITVAGAVGRLDLFPGSTTIIEVDLAHPDVNDVIFNTSLNFGGNNAFAGGTLFITNVGATPFTGSETFTIFKPNFPGDVLHNNFSLPVVVPPPGAGLTWDVSRVRTNGILRMAGLPTYGFLPTSTNLTFSWPYSYLGWRLEVQTNSRGIGISTQWFTVAGSVSTNLIRQPINKTNPPTFYRLAYP